VYRKAGTVKIVRDGEESDVVRRAALAILREWRSLPHIVSTGSSHQSIRVLCPRLKSRDLSFVERGKIQLVVAGKVQGVWVDTVQSHEGYVMIFNKAKEVPKVLDLTTHNTAFAAVA
jgi:hypothetical protein